MFGKRKAARPTVGSVRDTLFGDGAVESWPAAGTEAERFEPWATFVRAREALGAGRVDEAVAMWRSVTEMPGLESRHYLQAWHFLRGQGVTVPAERGKELLGVVVEVPMEGGWDLLAAYPERTARYYNYTGAGILWERQDGSLDEAIDALMNAGRRILLQIGPWEGARPAAPNGVVRLNLLAPSGLHFGQGSFEFFSKDPVARPAIEAATALMQRLVGMDPRARR